MQDNFIITQEKWSQGTKLDEYQGTYSLIDAKEGQGGEIFSTWAYPQDKDRRPRDKAIPVKVTLGTSKRQAIATLEYFLGILKGKDMLPPVADSELPEIKEPDIPF